MRIRKCTQADVQTLAALNKQLIEDERSSNPMNQTELEQRMLRFITGEYDAYFFEIDTNTVVGYALVKNSTPLYLRQFLIDRAYRRQHFGLEAFHLLLEHLHTETIDLEVLPWNKTGMRFWEKCGFQEISRYLRYQE